MPETQKCERCNDSMEVRNPKSLCTDTIPVERVPVGGAGDYKPVVAKLPNGDLMLSAYRPNVPVGAEPAPGYPGARILEPPLPFRSRDGGRTWSPPYLPRLDGKEPYLSVTRDGTLFITTHVIWQSILNREDPTYCYGMLHRSEDGGTSWTSMRAEPDVIRREGGAYNVTTRFPLELADGSLLLAASGGGADEQTMLRSTDGGITWPERIPGVIEHLPQGYSYSVMGEGVMWQARSGKIYGLLRVDPVEWPDLQGERLAGERPEGVVDQYDRLVLYCTTDLGRTWQPVEDFGEPGMMYPAILRLHDGRLLLTFTQRANRRPLGLRAVLGVEHEDGFSFDFDHDAIMIDTKTPDSLPSGGGFGCTVQLDDGTLVSSYSYRIPVDEFAGVDRQLHCEVARWRLP